VVLQRDPGRTGDDQADAVDTPRLVGSAVLAQPGSGELVEAVEFLAVDRVERSAVAQRPAGLHLAEDDDVRRPRDEVEFAVGSAPVACEHLHAVAPQMRGGVPLAEPSQFVRCDCADGGGVRCRRPVDGGGQSVGAHGRPSLRRRFGFLGAVRRACFSGRCAWCAV
jgi:hypothetical protein